LLSPVFSEERFLRRRAQKYQRNAMAAMTTATPPTAPPTIAPIGVDGPGDAVALFELVGVGVGVGMYRVGALLGNVGVREK
jgi:hypothetical protein